MFASTVTGHCGAGPPRACRRSVGRPILCSALLRNSSRPNAVVPTGRTLSPNGRSFGSPEPLGGGGGSGGPNGRGPRPPGGSGGSGSGGTGGLPDNSSGRGRMQPATILFGLFVLVGGMMGYKKKRSKDSLIASSIIAGLLLFSAYLMGKPNTTYGVRLAMVTTGTLAAYMGKGYYDKRKVFPQGVLAVLSSLMTVAYWGSVKQL